MPELLKKLDAVEQNAAKGNKEMQAGIDKIRKEAAQVKKARNTARVVKAAKVAAIVNLANKPAVRRKSPKPSRTTIFMKKRKKKI